MHQDATRRATLYVSASLENVHYATASTFLNDQIFVVPCTMELVNGIFFAEKELQTCTSRSLAPLLIALWGEDGAELLTICAANVSCCAG